MKKFAWTLAMVAIALAAVAPTSKAEAISVSNCLGKVCNLNLDCIPECARCSSQVPVLPGECLRF